MDLDLLDQIVDDTQQLGVLHLAAMNEDLETVELLASLLNVDGKDANGNTPLHHALQECSHLRLKIAKILVEAGATLTVKNKQEISPLDAEHHFGLLHLAARHGDFDALRHFLSKGCDPNRINIEGKMPVHYAILGEGQQGLDMTRVLLNNNADINCRSNRGRTPIHVVVIFSESDSGRWLEKLDFLVGLGADPYATDNEGRTILHLGTEFRNREDFHALLRWVEVNHLESLFEKTDNNLCTPLQSAVLFKRWWEQSLFLLLKYCRVNDTDIDGFNALFYAIVGNRGKGFLKLLIRNRAKWKTKDILGNNVLHLAASFYNADALRLFISKGCDVNEKNNNGQTPLHFWLQRIDVRETIKGNKHECLVVLLGNNASVIEEDTSGYAPVDLVQEILSTKRHLLEERTVTLLQSRLM